jgi:HD-GYP domain-containing protein (c-di-GMP phosphodiesterase class II)
MSTSIAATAAYQPIATATLCAAAILDCDLYVPRNNGQYMELYRGRSYPLDQETLDKLRAEGCDRLYIREQDRLAYEKYLREEILPASKQAAPLRLKALRELTRVVIDHTLSQPEVAPLVSAAHDFGRELSQIASERSIVFRQLYHSLEHDYYTFTHMCNVGIYSVMLASRMGISEQELPELATAALLHDIGKRHIAPAVLNKPGKLTQEEWLLIRQHPVSGYRELYNQQGLAWSQLMMVYQHHERLDGTGYPTGVSGDEVHAWARLCSVVDVFDALTCDRPYRKAMRISEACAHLEEHAGTWFDAEIVRCWTSSFGNAA